MKASRLTQLAADMVRRADAPRVLDYARPEAPRTSVILARLRNEVECRGGGLSVGLFLSGALTALAGLALVTRFRFGFALSDVGIVMVLVSRVIRGLREIDS